MLKLDIKLNFKSYLLTAKAELQQGCTLGLWGKSGIGKSTMLKVIAGLQKSILSDISYDGDSWNAKLSRDREVGLVFQDFALFPNLTVKENLKYAQKITDPVFDELVETLGISNIMDKKSNEISGGQKQRTAIGRAIAYDPKVLLMDEPFAALDDQIKQTIKTYLKSYLSDKQKIAIIASHDQSDLAFFTDHIISLREE